MTNVLRQLEVISADDMWAVGYYTGGGYPHTLTEHWDGVQWSIVPSASPGLRGDELWGVSAVSSNDIWAVGSYAPVGTQRSLVEHWDGVQWSVVPSPNAGTSTLDNILKGVAAISANDVWAAGFYQDGTLVEHWDGTQWNIVPSPNGGTRGSYLFSMDALAGDDIWAVGYYLTQTQGLTLVLHWDGVQWSIVSSPSPGAYHNQPERVAALSTHDIWAVGDKRNCFSGCPWQTLVEHYADPCAASSPTPTSTPTATGTVIAGHVIWQGRPGQPNALQQLPITLTLKLGANEINYPEQTTDASGFFTVSVAGLVNGTYNWRVKGPKYLANSGTVELNVRTFQRSNVPTVNVEMGLMWAGDANNDNAVNASDFNILKNTFGKSVGDPGYDDRADFTGDQTVNIADFNLLKGNFGLAGAPPLNP